MLRIIIKKTERMKSILAVIIAVGSMCACGDVEQEGAASTVIEQNIKEEEPQKTNVKEEDPKPTPATIPEEEPNPTPVIEEEQKSISDTTEEKPSEGTEEEKKIDDGKVVGENVESITIRYFIGYNIFTGDVISNNVPCFRIEVTGDDLESMANLVSNLSKPPVNQNGDGNFSRVAYLVDEYELTINEDLVITIGDIYGSIVDTSETFEVPAELYAIVKRITQEYNEKNVYKILGGDQISVTDENGKIWDVKDSDPLERIRSTQYYVVNMPDDMFEGERIAYVVDLHNGEQLDVYFASVLGRLRHADGTYEYVHIAYLEDYLNDAMR